MVCVAWRKFGGIKTNKMEKFKGTPGPWLISKETRGSLIYNYETGVLVADCDQRGTIGFNTAMPTANDANAKLIAAAPDLLDALQEIQKMCDRDFANQNMIWHKANQAMQKALK